MPLSCTRTVASPVAASRVGTPMGYFPEPGATTFLALSSHDTAAPSSVISTGWVWAVSVAQMPNRTKRNHEVGFRLDGCYLLKNGSVLVRCR